MVLVSWLSGIVRDLTWQLSKGSEFKPRLRHLFFEFSGSDDFQSSMGLADLLRAAGSAGHAHARIYAHRATVGIFFNK